MNSSSDHQQYLMDNQCPFHRVIHSEAEIRRVGSNWKDGGFWRVNATGKRFKTRAEAEHAVCPFWAQRLRAERFGKSSGIK